MVVYMRARIFVGAYKRPESFATYKRRLEYLRWLVIPTTQCMLLTFLLMVISTVRYWLQVNNATEQANIRGTITSDIDVRYEVAQRIYSPHILWIQEG